MVLADWMRRGDPAHAVCAHLWRPLARLGAVAGMAAAGWLLVGSAASYAEDSLPEDPHEVGYVAADITDSVERIVQTGTAATSVVTDEVLPVDLPVDLQVESTASTLTTPVTETTEAVGSTARNVVGTAARETGGALSGTVRTGQGIAGYADKSVRGSSASVTSTVSKTLTGESGLVGEKSLVGKAGLGKATRNLQGKLGTTLNGTSGSGGGLPLPHGDGHAAPQPRPATDAPARGLDQEPRNDREDGRAPDGDAPADHPLLSYTATADAAEHVATFAAGVPEAAGADDSRADDTPFDAPTWHGASDSGSTGTASSSSWTPTPATPGFLVQRGDALRSPGQRVALPGDPTLVVRDIADDPSFSPD
ncbi:hypothetical protein HNR23_005032 [Nocardiopsis mwathae]|uniref:Uncharacterized protein n=1 Tax=Nocardiopsis mwathae TaxID=1472723 RepID=A0A7W9YMM8_9ACTN|nr:hypothetical protein [Nocardiopsis mwathae]MBB6174972.1 hypothetical protein [Nocardiopsis mwathae]